MNSQFLARPFASWGTRSTFRSPTSSTFIHTAFGVPRIARSLSRWTLDIERNSSGLLGVWYSCTRPLCGVAVTGPRFRF